MSNPIGRKTTISLWWTKSVLGYNLLLAEKNMEAKSSIIQSLPFISIILALLFFIILRVAWRLKKHAHGDSGGNNLPNLRFEVNEETKQSERVQLKRPAVVEKSGGVMKVGIKELTTNGAFITCPHPFALGDSFAVKILLPDRSAHTFRAQVVWNNQNVIEEEIVSRGMKVRFLKLTDSERKLLQRVISKGLQAKTLP